MFINLKDFGEGMTVLDGKIYILTYTSGIGYIFDELTLEFLDTFKFTTTTGEVSYYLSSGDAMTKSVSLHPLTLLSYP